MAIDLICDNCGSRLRIPDEHAGKRVKCPTCSTIVSSAALPDADAGNPFSAASEGTDDRADGSRNEPNPYASPEAAWDRDQIEPNAAGAGQVTVGMRIALSQTRPWVIFLAVLGFISAGFMALGSLGMMIVFAVNDMPGNPSMWVVGGMYLAISVVYFFGSFYLMSYGTKIGTFLRSENIADMEAALVAQKSFWKLAGILAVLSLVLMALMFLGSIFFGVLAGMG